MARTEDLGLTKEAAQEILKKLGLAKKYRVLQGNERRQVETMLKLVPSKHSNNQRFWCETWQVGNITYNHYTGSGLDELEEVTEYE
jgi:hypothetical protein